MNAAREFTYPIEDENVKRWVMSPVEELQAWRDWFAKAGAGWDDVDDIEAELGRDE